MGKRIEIDFNGKLIIHNDNCTKTSNETTTQIEGDYLINANDIHKLMVLLENKHLLHSCQKEIEVLSKQKEILESLINKHNEKCGLFHKEIKLTEAYHTLNRELW